MYVCVVPWTTVLSASATVPCLPPCEVKPTPQDDRPHTGRRGLASDVDHHHFIVVGRERNVALRGELESSHGHRQRGQSNIALSGASHERETAR